MDHQPSTQLSPSERVLRIINIVAFIPGIAFLIATGIARGRIWALVGIAPLTLSAILSAAVVLIGSRYKMSVMLLDLFMAAFTLGIAIWGWADDADSWYGSGMIGGHATSVLLANVFIHSFFILCAVYHQLNIRQLAQFNPFGSRSSCNRCPHCLNEARAKKTTVRAVGGKESYHRVPGREDEYDEDADADAGPAYQDGRPSTDDESARLV